MATYSRSQTTTQTAQSTVVPSMDISSLLVKTMENVMNDKEDGDKGFEESVTKGINNSDLLKDKTKTDTDKELLDLLKDKKNSDKELSNLLKDTNKNAKDSKAEKKSSASGKLVGTGLIAATVGSVLKSKSLGQAAGGIVSGTGKLAGGLVSGIGDVGGAAIAGMGKLFGPIGAIVGKAVGAAVAAPFKIVGGTITAAIGGLGQLLSMPLKELVTKGTLIVGVLSQLFVFLEGLMAKFIAEKDIKWIDFMSKLKSSIATIPDRLMLSLEKLLSQIRIFGKPIFGAGEGLSKDEEKELKALKKKNEKSGVNSAQEKLFASAKSSGLFTDEELAGIDLSDEESRNTFQEEWKNRVDALRKSGDENKLNQLSRIDQERDIDKYFKRYNTAKSKVSPEDLARMAELEAKQAGGQRDFEQEERDLIDKENKLSEDYFAQGLYNYSQEHEGLTQYQQNYANTLHAGSVAKVEGMYQANNQTLTTRDSTGAERFLENQYKQWTDAWAKMFKDLKQDIGINITQKQDIPNPSYNNR